MQSGLVEYPCAGCEGASEGQPTAVQVSVRCGRQTTEQKEQSHSSERVLDHDWLYRDTEATLLRLCAAAPRTHLTWLPGWRGTVPSKDSLHAMRTFAQCNNQSNRPCSTSHATSNSAVRVAGDDSPGQTRQNACRAQAYDRHNRIPAAATPSTEKTAILSRASLLNLETSTQAVVCCTPSPAGAAAASAVAGPSCVADAASTAGAPATTPCCCSCHTCQLRSRMIRSLSLLTFSSCLRAAASLASHACFQRWSAMATFLRHNRQ